MSMQSVASPVYSFTPPRRNSLTHIPGDEGWPLIGKTLEVLADPKGQVERQSKKYGLVYRSHLFGETSLVFLGPEANELVLFDQAKLFSSTHGWAGRGIARVKTPAGRVTLSWPGSALASWTAARSVQVPAAVRQMPSPGSASSASAVSLTTRLWRAAAVPLAVGE